MNGRYVPAVTIRYAGMRRDVGAVSHSRPSSCQAEQFVIRNRLMDGRNEPLSPHVGAVYCAGAPQLLFARDQSIVARATSQLLQYADDAATCCAKVRTRLIAAPRGCVPYFAMATAGRAILFAIAKACICLILKRCKSICVRTTCTLVYNSCKDHQWNFSIAKAIMDGYNQVAKLRRNDILLMKPWLRFPRTTCLVLGPSPRFPLTVSKLKWAFASERRITRFLNQLNSYASNFAP